MLKAEELPHKVEIGGDTGALTPRVLQGLVHAKALGQHEVGNADGGGARDASEAVHQNATSLLLDRVYRTKGEKKRSTLTLTLLLTCSANF